MTIVIYLKSLMGPAEVKCVLFEHLAFLSIFRMKYVDDFIMCLQSFLYTVLTQSWSILKLGNFFAYTGKWRCW